MKKITLFLFTMLFTLGLFAQHQGIVPRNPQSKALNERTDPSVGITLGEVTTTTVEASFDPNEACISYYILMDEQDRMEMFSGMFGVPIDSLVHMWGILKTEAYTHLWVEKFAGTEYTIYVSPIDASGNVFPMQTLVLNTPTGGGSGVAEVDVQVSEITATSVRLIATPNEETALFHDGLITVDYYNEIGAEAVIEFFKSEPPLYQTDDFVWSNLEPSTAYYALAIGQNGEGEWGPATLVEFNTLSLVAEPAVEITLGEFTTSTVEVSFAPNEVCASYYILISTAENMEMFAAMFGVPLDSLVHMWGIQKSGDYDHLWTSLDAGVEYTIYASPSDAAGVVYPMQTLVFTTELGGGSGVAEIDVQISEITDTSVRVVATPNEETSVFHDGLITVNYFNEIGEEAAIEYFKNDGEPLYAPDNWVWLELQPATAYYAIAIGQNGNGEWGPATIVEFTTLPLVGILNPEAQQSTITLFPSPSNGNFTFKSVNGNNGKISIYNINGQMVHEQTVNGSESIINVGGLSNGLYQVVYTSKNPAETATQKLIISK